MDMRTLVAVMLGLLLCFSSCKEKEEEPRYSGEILLSSEILQSGQDYIFYGYSFQTGRISTYSLTSSVLPDLAVNHLELHDSINVDLLSSNDEDAFYKNGTFATAEEAEAYFNNYTEVIATNFQPIAYNIKNNQVWTVHTLSKHFAKIWIKDITVRTGSQSDYAELRIRYQYQPDGSRIFD